MARGIEEKAAATDSDQGIGKRDERGGQGKR